MNESFVVSLLFKPFYSYFRKKKKGLFFFQESNVKSFLLEKLRVANIVVKMAPLK